MNRILLIITMAAICATMLLAGCGYREGVTMKDKTAYIQFSGTTKNCVATVDDGVPFALEGSFYTDDQGRRHKRGPVLYEVLPGKHRVRVERDGSLVLDRTLLLGNQMTKEIILP
ncbi:hypothetical protein GGQ74_002715 [Desulfobaculum xiamenense]|uniref:Lipoprotein n=1 Tax=Desulfobaculum xiamenense TaxID=995050 RepID=A0A846QLP0_9BACT|nr:hypothetical protein [Desulfobaculum xiamenense]NJB69021.1 hypothetical protein [Desulfobaculum xiamenense]